MFCNTCANAAFIAVLCQYGPVWVSAFKVNGLGVGPSDTGLETVGEVQIPDVTNTILHKNVRIGCHPRILQKGGIFPSGQKGWSLTTNVQYLETVFRRILVSGRTAPFDVFAAPKATPVNTGTGRRLSHEQVHYCSLGQHVGNCQLC
ncbi:MAG: hypothetical protein ABJ251_04615 [Paracoccaceae bacterium]